MSKNIVITGSTRGIGLEMAKIFLSKTCNVTISGRGKKIPDKTKMVLTGFEDQYIYLPCNVQKADELQSLWDDSINKWGSIDIWINNAGQNAPNEFSWEIDEKSTRNIINTNIVGMILGSQIAAENMLKQNKGTIYSMEGLGSNNMIQPKTILYGTTKHALTYFMKGLAKELIGTSVMAGRLSPGMMLTDFIIKDSDGKPSDVVSDDRFKKIFNILGDRPETVACFLVPRILKNKKNNVHIMWLTNTKVFGRFLAAPFTKRKLF